MTVKLMELEHMTSELAGQLQGAGIKDSDQLLAALGDPKQRAEMAQNLKVDGRVLLKLANHADLARIKGIGKIYSSLLEFAGVDTVVELAGRKVENLHKKIMEVADSHHAKRAPRLDEVKSWVEQAKNLDRKINY